MISLDNRHSIMGFRFYFRRVGSDIMTSLSQSMISRYIDKYTALISDKLGPKYVKFPQTEDEITTMKMKFEAAYGCPGIIGVADGTHVVLSGVPKDIEIPFINRKQDHTLNVQLICGPDLYITNVNARYPGSTHDSFIFRSSRVYTFLQDYFEAHNDEWTYLLGKIYCCGIFRIATNNNHHFPRRRFGVWFDAVDDGDIYR